jgi:hypothetical protein
MKVKLLVSRAGAGFVQNRGDEIEVGDAEGARMIAAEQAVAVAEEKKKPKGKQAADESDTGDGGAGQGEDGQPAGGSGEPNDPPDAGGDNSAGNDGDKAAPTPKAKMAAKAKAKKGG